jgi:hypothetical protein
MILFNEEKLKEVLLREEHRRTLLHLFARFIKENQKGLKELNLIDYFFKGCDQSSHVKTLLKDLLSWGKPLRFFMVIVIKFSKPECYFEDEVCELLR